MGWQDRDYNPRREQMNAYFANPAAFLQFALPIFKSPGLDIRLSFWFLLAAVVNAVGVLRNGEPFYYILTDALFMLGTLLWHEFGHRVFSRLVGGNHWEWVIWPAGGMVAPTCPRRPWPTFVANVGGWVFNAVLLGAILGGLVASGMNFNFARAIQASLGYLSDLGAMQFAAHSLMLVVSVSFSILLINLFPCYWFDGGYIWQSILWPKFGQWKAIRMTCMAGMILSVPMFFLSLWGYGNFVGMAIAALIFADCFRRRQALAAAGPGVVEEDEGSSYNYMDAPMPRKKIKKRWFKSARKKAVQEQAEQAKIDAILAKVKEKGLHSLTWWEKRTLKKATERQRQRDLAGRY